MTHPQSPSTLGLVADVDHFAVHDGPGIRTAVYLKGCPLRCDWCHSPETQAFTPTLLFLAQKCNACGLCLGECEQQALSPVDESSGCRVAVDWRLCTHCGACAQVCYSGALKLSGAWVSAADLLTQVEKDRPFFSASGGGVTLTGGEASCQPAFARRFLQGCRDQGIHTALETNGCSPWQVYADLLPVVDLFLYDLKHMDDAAHRRLTGASNALILSNLRRLAESGANITVRIPCIPGLNDDPQNIASSAVFSRQVGVKSLHLLPYNVSAGAKYAWVGKEYRLSGLTAQNREKMDELAALCRSYGLAVQVEG